MSFQTYDVNAEQLEAVWTLDTPAGPIPLVGGQVSLDRSWTPALQATVEYPSGHELADQVHELSRDPLMLRLRTQTAGLPILDTLAYEAGVLGEYEWPEDDVYGSRVNQLALWAYPRSTRESRATGRTSVELASADLFMYEQRNGSGELFVPEPTRIFGGVPEYTITRAASQLIVHAGLRVTVKADTIASSPVDEPTWQPGANVWEFVSGLLRNQWTWRYDPKINALTLLYSGDGGAQTYDPMLSNYSPIDSVVTRGDSTELGTLDFADGLLITWQWQSRDGGRFTELETVIASHLDDWRDVSKWEEITINSAPQGYGQWLLDQRLVRRAQGTHTIALHPWSLDDLSIKWWDGPTPFQNITFNVADGTATITSPLREE